MVVKLCGGAVLFNHTTIHHRHFISEGKRFFARVSDENRRDSLLFKDLTNLNDQLMAHLSIDIGKRLIKQ
ncbi:Uncharacterised protein [Vibrio cholerae]|nr:Uncharacterised protein [Vibrio cholerae]